MDLGVSQRTVELHRARVMHKMKMRSLADLVSAIQKINEIDSARPSGAAPAQ
jgi:FixJ family two-component response regulator